MDQSSLATNSEVAGFLLRGLAVYLTLPLVAFLVYGLLSRENLPQAALKPFAGYSTGVVAAVLPVLFFPFARLEVPFTWLEVGMSGPGERPFAALFFLLPFHAGAIGVGFMAALIAGRFERLVAAISVWVGATLGYGGVVYKAISYTAEVSPFDPLSFVTMASYPLVALIGASLALRLHWTGRVSSPGWH